MRLPDPKPGLVVSYDYVWARESARGVERGKYRPSCIVVAMEQPDQAMQVVLVPITHAEPVNETVGVEIPLNVRKALQLDDRRCWAIVSEYNVDEWPNPGLAPASGRRGQFAYGLMPLSVFAIIRSELARLIRARRAKRVRRQQNS